MTLRFWAPHPEDVVRVLERETAGDGGLRSRQQVKCEMHAAQPGCPLGMRTQRQKMKHTTQSKLLQGFTPQVRPPGIRQTHRIPPPPLLSAASPQLGRPRSAAGTPVS